MFLFKCVHTWSLPPWVLLLSLALKNSYNLKNRTHPLINKNIKHFIIYSTVFLATTTYLFSSCSFCVQVFVVDGRGKHKIFGADFCCFVWYICWETEIFCFIRRERCKNYLQEWCRRTRNLENVTNSYSMHLFIGIWLMELLLRCMEITIKKFESAHQ